MTTSFAYKHKSLESTVLNIESFTMFQVRERITERWKEPVLKVQVSKNRTHFAKNVSQNYLE